MVIVNDKKFACESCIKGHRSSSCAHNDRPLFEVKKKGRPVSQCQQCRDLRKTKKVHSRCECHTKPEKPQVRQLTAASKRFIPILPALPNGLKDAITDQALPYIANPRAKVDTLLNPCTCKDIWSCNCRTDATAATICSGLDALANAAALCTQDLPIAVSPAFPPTNTSIMDKPIRSCCQPAENPTQSTKRKGRSSPSPSPPPTSKHRGPSLPPIHTHITPISPSPIPASPTAVPEFPTMPPLSSIAALAGSGCSCGFRCTCPGCVEHRGPEYASKDHADCPDGCGTCVDYEGGVELPTVHSHHCTAGPSRLSSRVSTGRASIGSSGASFVDSFFARADSISLPPAPLQRKRRGTLDPTDTTVYPSMLFAGGLRHLEERGPAFGLGNVVAQMGPVAVTVLAAVAGPRHTKFIPVRF
ncbi:hypothetical protein QCA50_008534 [Cerrena zonata]|uniref:Copper-fist domain-containing protein n=1 Tax=Cerrena zonata TaxID=2478898 RepID=A0AAW0GDH3_9APHY